MHWRIIMKRNLGSLIIVCSFLFSCVEPAEVKKSSSSSKKGKTKVAQSVESSGIAAKNFAQINNTYATLTGVSMKKTVGEYDLVQSQLPSSSNPKSLNGFNQIASTRLAFKYCEEYLGDDSSFLSLSNEEAAKNMIDQFIDVDLKGSDHKQMHDQVLAILRDDDQLLASNTDDRKLKLLRLSCAAILSSNYVTLI